MGDDRATMRARPLAITGVGVGVAAAAVLLGVSSCGGGRTAAPAGPAHVVAESKVAAGKYLVEVAGCNDCHTPGVLEGKQVPESDWLTGVPVGWRGPWGTTYASNLRLSVQMYTEETFVKAMKERSEHPPMPWASLHAMTDEDLGAVYAYIKSLGTKGDVMPRFVPPGAEPDTAYRSMVPVMPQAPGAGGAGKGQ